MSHLILLLPLLALVLFWILPLSIALPLYLIVLALSVVLYRSILQAMHRPVSVGVETMVGQEGRVVEVSRRGVRVAVGGEMWNARADVPLVKGDLVEILSIRGLWLRVRRAGGQRLGKRGEATSPDTH